MNRREFAGLSAMSIFYGALANVTKGQEKPSSSFSSDSGFLFIFFPRNLFSSQKFV